MTKANAIPTPMDAWVVRYVNKLKNMMGLSHWTILMQTKPSSPDALGETEVIHGQHLAKMYLHKDFRKDTAVEFRATIVHELLHCHMAHLSEVVSEILRAEDDDPKGKAILKTTVNVLDYEIERIIDAISESLGKWMPLPDMPKNRVIKKTVKKVVKKQVRGKK
jgi:hypothetical protein